MNIVIPRLVDMEIKMSSPLLPLALLGLFVVFQIFGGVVLASVAFITSLAFVQNITYSLQSRSATRNSNLYHMIAAVTSSLVFFATRQFLITKSLPFMFMPAYVFGTVFGSMHGKKLSQKIEKFIDARTGPSDKNKSQLFQFWPSLGILTVALVLEVLFLSENPKLLLMVAVLSFLSNFGFSIVRVTRNADNHWVHFGAILFEATASFALLKIMIEQQMDWTLFIPSLTGSMMSSLSGSELAKKIMAAVQASTDGHVKEGKKIDAPYGPLAAGASLMIAQFIIFGFSNMLTISILMMSVLAQSVSFSMVSRARQRSSDAYLVWCSFLSNGIWYLTMHLYTADKMPNYLFVPNTSATAMGALAGQDISMRVEKKIGAVMDEPKQQTKVSPA